MSMTLILWKAPIVSEPDEAKALLTPWYINGDESVFEPSADLAKVYDQLLHLHPYDAENGTDPWADPPQATGRLLVLSIRWGGDGAVLDEITTLARQAGLVLYDPQGPDVFLPDDPIDSEPAPPPSMTDALKTVPMVLVLLGLTYAAWLIPIGWLRWPAMIIAGFLAAAAVFVAWLCFGAALGLTKDEG